MKGVGYRASQQKATPEKCWLCSLLSLALDALKGG